MSSDSRILDELKRRINTKDGYKNTPLHYATQLWPQEVVRIFPNVLFDFQFFGCCKNAFLALMLYVIFKTN